MAGIRWDSLYRVRHLVRWKRDQVSGAPEMVAVALERASSRGKTAATISPRTPV